MSLLRGITCILLFLFLTLPSAHAGTTSWVQDSLLTSRQEWPAPAGDNLEIACPCADVLVASPQYKPLCGETILRSVFLPLAPSPLSHHLVVHPISRAPRLPMGASPVSPRAPTFLA
jgi:hypothetical protein